MTHLITFYKLDLFLVDFNISALKDSPFPDRMRQYDYTLLRPEATHIIGGLLDQVYIRNNANLFHKMTLQMQPFLEILMAATTPLKDM